jgi:hypothetical protein
MKRVNELTEYEREIYDSLNSICKKVMLEMESMDGKSEQINITCYLNNIKYTEEVVTDENTEH